MFIVNLRCENCVSGKLSAANVCEKHIFAVSFRGIRTHQGTFIPYNIYTLCVLTNL